MRHSFNFQENQSFIELRFSKQPTNVNCERKFFIVSKFDKFHGFGAGRINRTKDTDVGRFSVAMSWFVRASSFRESFIIKASVSTPETSEAGLDTTVTRLLVVAV